MIKWISSKLDDWAALRCPCCKYNKYKDEMFRLHVLHPLLEVQLQRYTRAECYEFVRSIRGMRPEYIDELANVLWLRSQRGKTDIENVRRGIKWGLEQFNKAMEKEHEHNHVSANHILDG